MSVVAHGVDIVDVSRIASMLAEHGDRFLLRCFTEDERAYADGRERRRAEHYAARFACKEAVLKAIGTGWRDGISWTDVAVARTPSGAPEIRLAGRCAEIAASLGITSWHVSLSHTEDHAIASVIGCSA